jgi:hypothetical protein
MDTAELSSEKEVAEYVVRLVKDYGSLSEKAACSFIVRKFGGEHLNGDCHGGFSLAPEIRAEIQKLTAADLTWHPAS